MLTKRQLVALQSKKELTKSDIKAASEAIYDQCGHETKTHEIFKANDSEGLDGIDGDADFLDELIWKTVLSIHDDMLFELDLEEDDWVDKKGYEGVSESVIESIYAGLS